MILLGIYARHRAVNETRTRDPDLGKVVLYQLSYYRVNLENKVHFSKCGCKGNAFFLTDKFFSYFFFVF